MNLFQAILDAKEPDQYGEYIPGGDHTLALAKLEEKTVTDNKTIFAAEFMVLSTTSDKIKAGDLVSMVWSPHSSAFPGAGAKEMGKLKKFISELIGSDDERMVAQTAVNLIVPEQPGRGIVIKSKGIDKQPKPRKDGNGMTKAYTLVHWYHVDSQSREQIAAVRAEIDSRYPLEPTRAAEPAPVVPSGAGVSTAQAPVPAQQIAPGMVAYNSPPVQGATPAVAPNAPGAAGAFDHLFNK